MNMNPRDIEMMLEMLGGAIGSFIGPIIGGLLSGTILTYCIRWFIFAKAGEKGWKALIPFYSDYINFKITWDGRIYLALLIGSIASAVLGSVFGLIHPVLGMVVSVVLSVIVAGANVVSKMILQFKYARAFGKNDYFAVGLYFLNNVFAAILAFGDCEYQGAQTKDGIGVPRFIENIGSRKPQERPFPPVQQPMQPMHTRPVQPVQQPVQPVQRPMQPMNNTQPIQPVQQLPQGGYQQPYNTGSYPPVQGYPQQPYNAAPRGFMQQPYSQQGKQQDSFHQ